MAALQCSANPWLQLLPGITFCNERRGQRLRYSHSRFFTLATPQKEAEVSKKWEGGWEFDEDDDEDELESDDDSTLEWVRTARESAVEAMRVRGFSDRDFDRLLPKKIRAHQPKKTKKKMMKQENVDVGQLQKESKKKKKKKPKNIDDEPTSTGKLDEEEAILTLATKYRVTSKEDKVIQKLHSPQRNSQIQTSVSVNHRSSNSSESDEEDNDDAEEESDADVNIRSDGRIEEEDDSELVKYDALHEIEKEIQHSRDIRLNRKIVEAMSASEVLEVVSGPMMKMSPINAATALHRIGKYVVKKELADTRRLTVARQKEMFELVARAMQLLPKCSAQGIANIAWALSKIGGRLLYVTEMDAIAKTTISKYEEMNPQNVANLAAAFASMQHAAPDMFHKLAMRASQITDQFEPQALSQLLWAFACMGAPLDPFLDSLDRIVYENPDSKLLSEGALNEQLAGIGWSYAVLDAVHRPFLAHICKLINRSSFNDKSAHHSVRKLCQLHQLSMSLRMKKELNLDLGDNAERIAAAAWNKDKFGKKSTSVFQKELRHFLGNMNRNWCLEYKEGAYSLDFALVSEKIGMEVNGPSHFARNTGEALGHMILKERIVSGEGWRLISMPYYEWEELDGESEHQDYLQNKLAPYGL